MRMVVVQRVRLSRMDANPGILREERGDAIVRRCRASGDHELGAAGAKHLHQHRRLRLDVQAHADASTVEWAPARELLAKPA